MKKYTISAISRAGRRRTWQADEIPGTEMLRDYLSLSIKRNKPIVLRDFLRAESEIVPI